MQPNPAAGRPPPAVPHHSGVMRYCTSRVPTARLTETVGAVQARIHKEIPRLDTLNYIYILDDRDRLVNVLSLKELSARRSTARLARVVEPRKLCTVRETADRERAAYMALRHNIKAVPVVDRKGTFLGVVPSDAIHRILYREMREDLLRLAGITHPHAFAATIFQVSPLTSLRHRLPWLLIGMAGGILSAGIIHLFQATLEQTLLLAAFIPLIVFMTNAVAIQMNAYLIRDLSADASLPFFRYVSREMVIVLLLALCCATLLWGMSLVLYGNAAVSLVLGLTLFCGILSAIVTGVLFPFGFHRLRLDPADASGPIGTIVQDNVSILLYFAIAMALL